VFEKYGIPTVRTLLAGSEEEAVEAARQVGYPIGRDADIDALSAAVVRVIDDSGLPYVLTPTGICIEGSWESVIDLVKRCHEEARSQCSHVMTELRIEDDDGRGDKLRGNIAAIERAAGRDFRTTVFEAKAEHGEQQDIC
jgi:uncharacterized protein YqgV (UPF0045/DUF77 family)